MPALHGLGGCVGIKIKQSRRTELVLPVQRQRGAAPSANLNAARQRRRPRRASPATGVPLRPHVAGSHDAPLMLGAGIGSLHRGRGAPPSKEELQEAAAQQHRPWAPAGPKNGPPLPLTYVAPGTRTATKTVRFRRRLPAAQPKVFFFASSRLFGSSQRQIRPGPIARIAPFIPKRTCRF